MDPHRSFDVLSGLLEQYGSRGGSVECVETYTEEGGARLRATVDVTVPLCSRADDEDGGLTPSGVALTDDGGLEVAFSTIPFPDPETTANVDASKRAARTVDGTIVLTVDLTITPAGDEGPESRESPDVRDESLPPYEDTAYLEWLYASCDTFAEMSRHIEMDVSSETVRRYMIEAGVHDPTSYDTSDDDGAQPTEATTDTTAEATGAEETADVSSNPSSPGAGDAPTDRSPPEADNPIETIPDEQLVTDGLGLPADLTIEDIADAVVDSMTVYEVHRRLGLEQERTRNLLKRLHLIDLVLHQMNGNPERETTYEEVAARIRECAPQESRESTASI